MEYFFAPMEGLTDAVYRHLHHKYFPGVTGYYTPFFSPTRHRQLTPPGGPGASPGGQRRVSRGTPGHDQKRGGFSVGSVGL